MKRKRTMIQKGLAYLLTAGMILCFFPMIGYTEKGMPDVFRPTVEVLRSSSPQYSLGAELGTARNKEAFNRLFQEGLQGLLTSFNIRYTGSDIDELFDDIKNDKTGKYLYGMEYHHWTVKEVSLSASGYEGDMAISVQATYHHTSAEEEALNNRVDEVLRKMISGKMSSLEKVDAVHDYIVLMTEYGTNTSGSPHSAYTVMTERKGVCQGYATLGYKMLEKMGFEVRIVPGAAGEDHSWLKVLLDGEWYNLDITFDDPVPDRKNTVHYKYDLLSDGLISSDHTENPDIPFPKATSTKYDDRTNRSPKTYTDAEVDALLNGGGDAPEPPSFDEDAYFNRVGASQFAAPIEEYTGRDHFKVLFNKPLSSSGMKDLSVLEVSGNTAVKMQVRAEKKGNYVYLYMDRVLPKGVYYVLVGSNTMGANGEKLNHGWYRKFVLK